MDALTHLSTLISKLPGLGPKTARRIAVYILKSDENFTKELSSTIATIKDILHPCSVCGTWCEDDVCDICKDESRDKTTICVVENSEDILSIESSKTYRGVYHVLGGRISPLNGVYPENLNFEKLKSRAKNPDVKELIIATNPNEEGETTAYYIKQILKDLENLRFTRPAIGLTSGGNIEFASQISIIQSLTNRKEI